MPSELEPDIVALLQRERSAPYDDGARKVAVARRLEHAAIALAVAPLAFAPLAFAPSAVRHGLAARLAKHLFGAGLVTKVGVAALLVGTGGVMGATLEARHEAATSKPVVAQSSVATPPAAQPSAASSSTEVPSLDVSALRRVAVSAAAAQAAPPPLPAAAASGSMTPARSQATSLGEEQRLLDTARAGVARGAYGPALATLTEHQRRFPQGRLAEERELLVVQALAGKGDTAEAAAVARAFEARFPDSIFLPAVRAASTTKER